MSVYATRLATYLFVIIGISTIIGCGHFEPIERAPNSTSPTSIEIPRASFASTTFTWPIKTGRFSRGFKGGRRPHMGIDISAPKGTPIYSAQDGVVLYAGREFSGYGKLVIIEQDSWATFYSHCNKILVNMGDKIKQGKQIATVGRTGNASGNHLHFELRKDRIPVDPLLYLQGGKRGLATVHR